MVKHQRVFGYTAEEMKILLGPMAQNGAEPIGSMGTDTPVAALSNRSRLLFDYFQQLFAQVTNPPLDAIREEMVTSMAVHHRTRGEPARPAARVVPADRAALADHHQRGAGQAPLHQRRRRHGPVRPFAIDGLYPVAEGGEGMRRAIADVRTKVSAAIADGAKIIILSDRHSNAELAPIPSLLLTSAVHHHLIREKSRTQVGLVVECGDAREVHHMALLCGYGAGAINPYLAFETIDDLHRDGLHQEHLGPQGPPQLRQGVHQGRAQDHVQDGHLDDRVIHRGADLRGGRARRRSWSTSTSPAPPPSSAASASTSWPRRCAARHEFAYLDRPAEVAHRDLWMGGEYQWRREGEYHLFNPETVYKLQHATRERLVRDLQGVHVSG